MDPNTKRPQQPLAPQPTQQQVLQNVDTNFPLSKVLLIVLGVIFITGFIGGIYYFAKLNGTPTQPTPSNLNAEMLSCASDDDCELQDKDYSGVSPHCCLDFSSPNVIAFNGSWYNQYRTAHPVHGVCNMACTYNANSARYTAKCINHTCQKFIANR